MLHRNCLLRSAICLEQPRVFKYSQHRRYTIRLIVIRTAGYPHVIDVILIELYVAALFDSLQEHQRRVYYKVLILVILGIDNTFTHPPRYFINVARVPCDLVLNYLYVLWKPPYQLKRFFALNRPIFYIILSTFVTFAAFTYKCVVAVVPIQFRIFYGEIGAALLTSQLPFKRERYRTIRVTEYLVIEQHLQLEFFDIQYVF